MRYANAAAASLVLAAGLLAGPALAQEVYKCKQPGGQLAYQDHPCDANARDAGTVNGGYATPLSGSGTASDHYRNYLDMVDREHAQRQAENSRLEAEERRRQAEPPPMQADQRDYRSHICQAQLDYELDKHRHASFSCDAQGNKVPTLERAVIVVPGSGRR